jgi:hypothetical protein
VPETVPPLAGALKETVGADCALKGIAAKSEMTASAVDDFLSIMDNPSLSWGMDYVGCLGAEAMPPNALQG